MNHIYVFVATDETGTRHTVNVYEVEGDARTIGLPGKIRLLTDKGEIVKALGRGVYEIHRGSRRIRVTTDDKNAEKFST